MTIHELRREQHISRPREAVFEFFANAANLEQITPAWLKFEILSPQPIQMAIGTQVTYRVRWRFFGMRWVSEIAEWDPPNRFLDVQLRGPYAFWHHTHSFAPDGDGTRIVDVVRYSLPFGILGRAANWLTVAQDLNAIFDYRAERISTLLEGYGGDKAAPNIARASLR
jgi:ligand-binding SRPBCC domain-containing protein